MATNNNDMTATAASPKGNGGGADPDFGVWPTDEEVAAAGKTGTDAGVAENESDQFSIAALRLTTDYVSEAVVKKIITTVPVRRPPKSTFIRVRDGAMWAFPTYVLERKEQGEWFAVARSIWPSIPGELVAVTFHVSITRDGSLFLLPARLPGPDGRMNPWHESLVQAIGIAKRRWVRIMANTDLGAYDVLEAQGEIPDPVWPDMSLQEIVDIAFRGRKIDSLDHPVIRGLLGRA